jgi:hypothetical protein
MSIRHSAYDNPKTAGQIFMKSKVQITYGSSTKINLNIPVLFKAGQE